jgi:predicted nucleic acid-binding protein
VKGGSEPRKQPRLFLDSNVLTGGVVSRWGLDKAVLSLCAAKICRLVLAEAVREEVEDNLLLHAAELNPIEGQQLLDDYTGLIKLARPEIVPYPSEKDVLSSRRLIAHEADVPILLSAMEAKPDWLLTHNTKHFTPQVAKRTGLRIGSPAAFFWELSQGIS